MAPNTSTQQTRPYPPRHSSMGNHRSTATGEEGANGNHHGPHFTHPHGVVASHFLAQRPPNGQGGETWMDFLADPDASHASRTAAAAPSSSRYTLPNRPSHRPDSSSRSSERKRRLTTADSPMRRPSSIRMHSGTSPGTSSSDPIVLDSSPMQPRRGSDIVLPPWQPDHEVSQCPVCSRSFTFLFRKHHCRKCGRVVCASCSPHRITIPRQFIVHPPSDGQLNFIDLTADDDSAMSTFGPFRNPALGGGEEVRVCNPCVPDPNYGPPPQYSPSLPSRYSAQSTNSPRPLYPPHHHPSHSRSHPSPSNIQDVSRNIVHGQMQRSHDSHGDSRRATYHGSAATGERWLPPLPNTHMQASPHHLGESNSSIPRYMVPNNGQLLFGQAQRPQPGANMFPIPHQQAPRPTRRQIAEEDECPICGNELPPKGPNGDEANRTQHIEECIALHSASPAPTPLTHQTSTSLPAQRTRGMSNPSGEASSSSNRMSHAARGMFPFIATEKDCIDTEGNEEECVICFEEYQAGDRMARLVCWCKFHETCIKEWWDKKGRGACPTHQLHE